MKLLLRICLALTVAVHLAVVAGNVIAAIIVPFWVPWYVALPIETYLINLLFSPFAQCPITSLENKIRSCLGMPEIEDFLSHYLKWRARIKLKQTPIENKSHTG